MATQKKRMVLVTTEYKGVFIGIATGPTKGKDPIVLEDCRMAIYWGTSNGVFQLAKTGPTSKSRISDPVESIELRKITSVTELSKEAVEAWKAL